MALIKRNLNTLLLIFVLVLAFSLVLLTTYYHNIYSSLSNEYYTKAMELNKVTNDLFMHKSRLNQTMTQYQIKDEREKDLSAKYSELRELKEQLVFSLNQTNTTLQETRQELQITTKELLDAVKELEEKNLQILTLNTHMNNLQTTISDYETRTRQIETDAEYVEDEINDYLSSETTPESCKSMISNIKSRFLVVKEDISDLEAVS